MGRPRAVGALQSLLAAARQRGSCTGQPRSCMLAVAVEAWLCHVRLQTSSWIEALCNVAATHLPYLAHSSPLSSPLSSHRMSKSQAYCLVYLEPAQTLLACCMLDYRHAFQTRLALPGTDIYTYAFDILLD